MENDKQNIQFLLLCFYLYVELNVGTVGSAAMRDGPRVELGIGLRRIFFPQKIYPQFSLVIHERFGLCYILRC